MGWSNVEVAPLTGGLTNVLYTCDSIGQRVVYRIYGGSCELNRKEEAAMAKMLGQRGLGPIIYGMWDNGRIEQFMPGKCLRIEEQWRGEIMRKIAQKMKSVHDVEMPLDRTPVQLQRILDLKQKVITKGVNLAEFNPFIELVERFLSTTKADVAFCHNDAHEGNIMYNRVDGSLSLIDFEYAGYNYTSYDIANHFCEWMFSYDIDETPYFKYLPSQWPSDKTIRTFLSAYFHCQKCDQELIDFKINEIKQFSFVSSVYWALWALSKDESEINFDYSAYAHARLDAMRKMLIQLDYQKN